MKVAFEIPGRPVAKQRARTVNGHTYTPPRTRQYEQTVREAAEGQPKILGGRLGVAIQLHTRHRLTGDLDNYAKAILDGICKAETISDDRYIDSLIVTRASGKSRDYARVLIEVLADD